jgi:hypothetical protein
MCQWFLSSRHLPLRLRAPSQLLRSLQPHVVEPRLLQLRWVYPLTLCIICHGISLMCSIVAFYYTASIFVQELQANCYAVSNPTQWSWDSSNNGELALFWKLNSLTSFVLQCWDLHQQRPTLPNSKSNKSSKRRLSSELNESLYWYPGV